MQYESFHLELDANVMFLFAQQNMSTAPLHVSRNNDQLRL